MEPIVNGGPDPPAFDRGIPRPVMAGDEQKDSIAERDRLFKRTIDRPPCLVEAHPVKVEDPVGLDRPAPKAPVPGRIERGSDVGWADFSNLRRRTDQGCAWGSFLRGLSNFGLNWLARQRPDGGRHPGPEFGLVRAERTHAPLPPSAAGSAPGPTQTFRRRWRQLPAQRPRRCRNDSGL